MNKWIYILFLILIISCGMDSKQMRDSRINDNPQLIINIYEANEDSLIIKTLVLLPISNLVFIKKNHEFSASIESVIRIEDNSSGLQIERISDNKKIFKKYYEDTRSDELHQLEYQFLLKKGDYKLIATIKDLDSYNVWNHSENIKFKAENNLAPYYYDNQIKKYIFNETVENIDTVWVEIPEYKFQKNNYKYIILKDDSILDSSIVENCNIAGIFLECPISIPEDISGDIKIHITSNSGNSFISFIGIHDKMSLWSSDINAILGVMSYILSYSEIRQLYDLEKQAQLRFISDYLESNDPTPTTKNNEFLEIIKIRYQYANDNFSEYNIGWKTDRGEIYIINGPPHSIDYFYDNAKMINFEKWYYTNKEYIFSDEKSFGEMQLINQF